MNPSFITLNLGSALPVTSGGTGLTTIPTNGQLLIGNGTGYTLNPLTAGIGIGITNGAGTIAVSNTGVLSFAGGPTGLTPIAATTGNISLAGTLLPAYGGTGINSYAVGDLIYASAATTLSKLSDVATGNALISGGVTTAPSWGKIGLTTHVSGILPIANGGTNNNATPTAGAIAYGSGTTYAFTAAGVAGQVLTSAGAGTPVWTAAATGTVTSVSVVSANGFAGTVATSTTTPAITLSTTVTGLVKGNGTILSAATAATDYVAPSSYASANGLTMATSRLLGRTTATTGAAEEISVAGGLTLSAGTLTGTSGTVTSVTGTSPVVSSGGANPAISMPAATTSVNGYLTSTDWTTFNNKGSGTVTSVSGTAGRVTSTGGATPVIDLASGVATPGTTGSALLIPVVTIDTYGRVTGITTAANPQGTVTAVSVVSANGLAGTSSGGATPALTLSTSITGVLKGNGTAISAAVSGTDYAPATSGSSILYGNSAGGFSNVTVGTGLTFVAGTLASTASGGTVTTVSFTGGIITVANPTTTPALTVAGTSGGIPYFSNASTWASSGVLAASSLVVGGGAGATPATVTTGTGVVTALGVNTNTAGAFMVNGGNSTFTPAISIGGSGPTSYLTQVGNYIQLGTAGNGRIFFTITVRLNVAGAATGNVTFTGLPIAARAGASTERNSCTVFMTGYAGGALTTEQIWATVAQGATVIDLWTYTGGTASAFSVGALSNSQQFNINGSYPI